MSASVIALHIRLVELLPQPRRAHGGKVFSELTPSECLVLLDPVKSKGKKTVKLTLLDLLSRRCLAHEALEEQTRFPGKPVRRLYFESGAASRKCSQGRLCGLQADGAHPVHGQEHQSLQEGLSAEPIMAGKLPERQSAGLGSPQIREAEAALFDGDLAAGTGKGAKGQKACRRLQKLSV